MFVSPNSKRYTIVFVRTAGDFIGHVDRRPILFQHITALDMPITDKNPFTTPADLEQGRKSMPVDAPDAMALRGMAAKARISPRLRCLVVGPT